MSLIPHQWEIELHPHPDQQLVSYIVSGITNGFHLGYQREGASIMSARSNMILASQNPSPVQQYLATELAKGRTAGPLQ